MTWASSIENNTFGVFQNSTSPTFTLRYADTTTTDVDNVVVNGSRRIIIDMVVAPDAVYAPMEVEFITPVQNDSAVITICHAEIIHVGKNIPCLNATEANQTVEFTSRYVLEFKKAQKRTITLVLNEK